MKLGYGFIHIFKEIEFSFLFVLNILVGIFPFYIYACLLTLYNIYGKRSAKWTHVMTCRFCFDDAVLNQQMMQSTML